MLVRFLVRRGVQNDINIRGLKACENNLKTVRQQALQFDGEDLLVPTGFLGQPIVGQDVSPLLRCAQVGDLDGGDLGKSQKLGGLNPSVPGDYLIALVNQDGIVKPEPHYSSG